MAKAKSTQNQPQSLDSGDETNPLEQHVQALIDDHRAAVEQRDWIKVIELEGGIRALGQPEIVEQLERERPALIPMTDHDMQAMAQTSGDAFKAASPRELIDALINRIGRVEAVRGVKYPPLRVMAQELRDSKQSMEGHPALDEKRL